MAVFRSLKDSHGEPLVDNFRPVMELNDRIITVMPDPGDTHIHSGSQHHAPVNCDYHIEDDSKLAMVMRQLTQALKKNVSKLPKHHKKTKKNKKSHSHSHSQF